IFLAIRFLGMHASCCSFKWATAENLRWSGGVGEWRMGLQAGLANHLNVLGGNWCGYNQRQDGEPGSHGLLMCERSTTMPALQSLVKDESRSALAPRLSWRSATGYAEVSHTRKMPISERRVNAERGCRRSGWTR